MSDQKVIPAATEGLSTGTSAATIAPRKASAQSLLVTAGSDSEEKPHTYAKSGADQVSDKISPCFGKRFKDHGDRVDNELAQMKAFLPQFANADVGSQKVETSTPFIGYQPTSLFAKQQNIALQASALTTQLQMNGRQVQIPDHSAKSGPLSMLELVKLHNMQTG